jgi:quercetin dioxygenase-like cupin family protein
MKAKINALHIAIAMMFITLTSNYAARAQSHEGHSHAHHTMLSPDDIVWQNGPESLPPGAKMAVLFGDPGSAGLFTLRAKFPAGYIVPAHWHPADENITVISGKLKMGLGDKFQRSDLKTMRPGAFGVMPANSHHFAAADEETIIQVHGMGPFAITYINPADDPRNKPKVTGR